MVCDSHNSCPQTFIDHYEAAATKTKPPFPHRQTFHQATSSKIIDKSWHFGIVIVSVVIHCFTRTRTVSTTRMTAPVKILGKTNTVNSKLVFFICQIYLKNFKAYR